MMMWTNAIHSDVVPAGHRYPNSNAPHRTEDHTLHSRAEGEFVSIMTGVIIGYLREQRLEQSRATAEPRAARPPGEGPGHSLAP